MEKVVAAVNHMGHVPCIFAVNVWHCVAYLLICCFRGYQLRSYIVYIAISRHEKIQDTVA